MKEKIFIILMVIMTFGLFLIPISFAKPYEQSGQLDYVNRLTGITTDLSNTSSVKVNLYVNNDNYTYSTYVYTLQAFNVNDLQTPVNISTFSGLQSVQILNRSYAPNSSATIYTTNNNFAYYSSGSVLRGGFQLQFTSVASADLLKDYVFNITLTPTNTYLGTFVGNTYYNIGGENNKGVFQNFRVELWQQYVSTTGGDDITSQVVSFNKIQFVEPLLSQIAEANNVNGYQYYIRIYFGGVQVETLPQFNTRYLELSQIRARGITYTSYSSARNSLTWLGTDMQLYNTSGQFFKPDWTENANRFDTIDWVEFRIVDYTFKSSNYYSSSIGIKGYLTNTYFTSLNSTEVLVSNESFQNGFDSGYNRGYVDGYASSSAQHNNSFGDMILSVADVPVHIIYQLLNFNILGTNLLSLFTAFITLFMFIWLVKRFKE